MGSHPTLDQQQPAAEALESDPDDWISDHHHHRPAERTSEQAFDRLNPTFGVPAERTDRLGHRDVTQREAALALGIRVAVHDSPTAPNATTPRHRYRLASPPGRGGEGHGRRRPPGQLRSCSRVGARRRQAEPAPTLTTRRKEPAWGATPP